MKSIYKSPEGKRLMLGFYDKMQGKLSIPIGEKYVDTSLGKTHLLIAGPEHAEPLVFLQGAEMVLPFDLKAFEGLAKKYRVYAPDIVGQPGKTAETRPSHRNDDFGKWLVDILDGLGIKDARFVGMSYGGGILLKLAAYRPERIKKAVFIVPMAIAMASNIKLLFTLFAPMLLYIAFPSRERLFRALAPMFSDREEMSEDLLEAMEYVFLHMGLFFSSIKAPKKSELRNFAAPSMLIAAEKDVFFPAKKIVPKAKARIPNLARVRVLKEGTHFLSERHRYIREINEDLLEFLRA